MFSLNNRKTSDVDSGKKCMIHVTRLNHSGIALNSDLIQEIEATPDTVITLTTGHKITVVETVDDIVQRMREWRRSICQPDPAALSTSSQR